MWEDIYEKLREWLATQQGFVNPITGAPSLERQPGSLPLEGQVWENIQPILSEQAYGPITSDVDQASILAEKQAEMAGRSGLGRESYVPKITEEEEDEGMSDLNKLFLMSMMENMQGGDIGQAPAVVAGGGRREFPTMMRQFAPWEREKPYWWMR